MFRNWEDFNEFMRSKEFFMYDQIIKGSLIQFQLKWNTLKELLKEYKHGSVYYTHNIGNQNDPKRFDQAKFLIKKIEESYTEVLTHVRMNYLEIKFRKS